MQQPRGAKNAQGEGKTGRHEKNLNNADGMTHTAHGQRTHHTPHGRRTHHTDSTHTHTTHIPHTHRSAPPSSLIIQTSYLLYVRFLFRLFMYLLHLFLPFIHSFYFRRSVGCTIVYPLYPLPISYHPLPLFLIP